MIDYAYSMMQSSGSEVVVALLIGFVAGYLTRSVAYSQSDSLSGDGMSSASRGDDDRYADKMEFDYGVLSGAGGEKERFVKVFPYTKSLILKSMSSLSMPSDAIDWVSEVIEYNVQGGKLNRGLTVLSCRTIIKSATPGHEGSDLTDPEFVRTSVLGWCVEYLQAFFLVADDVMDNSETRRGKPCWYKVPKVGVVAINDSFILESCVFQLIDHHFCGSVKHMLKDIFLEVVNYTEYGQLLDLTSQPTNGPIDLDRFTADRYDMIVKFKTSYYTFYLPIAISMVLSGITSPEAFRGAKRVCEEMGKYFQVQDDYLDCYGDSVTIGKVGTDIQDSKCSWLVVQALKLCDGKQRKVINSNYGSWDGKKVQRIKALYEELNLEGKFREYEEDSYARIKGMIGKVEEVPSEVFDVLLKKIYKREK